MPTAQVPTNIPENLHHLASKLSWEDATHLLCWYEGWMIDSRDKPEIRIKVRALVEQMRLLVRGLPYDWSPPPVDEYDIITAIAAYVRTGTMPKAPPGYSISSEPNS